MSTDKIDKAICDKDRYESLRKRGVSEERAKRISTVPLEPSVKDPSTEKREPAYSPKDARISARHSRPASVKNVTDNIK